MTEKNTVTKAQLVAMSHAEQGFSKREVKTVLDGMLEAIKLNLEHGRDVQISGFGTFFLRDKAPRPGRNPRTGQAVEVAARRVVGFRSSHRFKKALNSR